MAFQGSLKELPLPDIIQLVSVSGKTGKFTLAQEGATGYIYLKNGQMIHATVLDLVGEEAIYALAIWNQGEFQFSPNEEAPQQTISKSNTNLLMEAARRLDEWRVLSKKIPSVDVVPVLVPRQNRHEQITLNPQEWLIITQIDSRRSIAEVGKVLRMSGFDVAKLLYGLITSELVDLKKKPEPNGQPIPAASGDGSHLIALADQIRVIADKYIGESGAKTVDKHYQLAVDAIRSGKGEIGIRTMVAEFEKATSLLRGLAMSEQFRQEIGRLRR
ncbi:MAG: DUF4388 domain-containing protein [Acidobacteria bacterium]|nr:DUF4388 domain-containing protein [Acidobacteriota bacterium]